MDKLGLNLGYLLLQVFNFLILFVVLRVWVYKPILGLLEKRRRSISQGLEDARVAAAARADAEKQAAKILADAQAEAGKVVREATERAAAAGKDVKAADRLLHWRSLPQTSSSARRSMRRNSGP